MSTEYVMYTEVMVDGKWICVCPKIMDLEHQKELLIPTWESGSYSYFGETYYKLSELGRIVLYDDLSDELKEVFHSIYHRDINGVETYVMDAYQNFPIQCNVSFIDGILPKENEYECHAYVHKDILFELEHGDLDDIPISISPEEYNELDVEGRQAYQYHEWDDPMNWVWHFKRIAPRIHQQITDWQSINYGKQVQGARVVVHYW